MSVPKTIILSTPHSVIVTVRDLFRETTCSNYLYFFAKKYMRYVAFDCSFCRVMRQSSWGEMKNFNRDMCAESPDIF